MYKPIQVAVFAIFSLLVMLVPALALGHECAPIDVNVSTAEPVQEWWMALLSNMLPAVGSLAAMVITTFVGIGVRKWGHKLDADKQTALITMTNDFVKAGVGFAEEQGRKALRQGEEGTPGADKMNSAMEFIMGRFEASGMQRIGEDELKKLIESRVAHERAKPDGVVASESAMTMSGPPAEAAEATP